MNIKKITNAWKQYNKDCVILSELMNGTSNIVGEFAETIVAKLYDAKKFIASTKSADLITKNKESIQVKSRVVETLTATPLNVIRSWSFDYLVVVIFDKKGDILHAIEMKSTDAKKYAKTNKHQNGDIITTTKEFLFSNKAKDITKDLRVILN